MLLVEEKCIWSEDERDKYELSDRLVTSSLSSLCALMRLIYF